MILLVVEFFIDKHRKKKTMINKNLIGNYYPMYLGNEGTDVSCYLYQVVSPGLTEKLDPIISMQKVGEITKKGDFQAKSNTEMMSSDILAYLNGKSRDGILDYFKELIDDENVIDYGESEFPGFVMKDEDPSVQKGLIVDIRDAIRWKYYKFAPGSTVDILWTPTQYAVCEVVEGSEKDSIRLVPKALYDMRDIARVNPIPCEFENYVPQDFSGKYRVSELNRTIKKIEINSFNDHE